MKIASFRTPRYLWHYAKRAPGKISGLARLWYHTRRPSPHRTISNSSNAAPPALITLQINNRCNLRCVQCWEWGNQGAFKAMPAAALHEELSTESWKAILDQLAPWKPYIYFFGGEPLLREDLAELIAHATKRGILVSLNSNTTLMDDAKAESLVRAGLDYFIASLDGPEAINDRIRIGKNVYANVIRGIRALIAARGKQGALPFVDVVMTLTPANQEYILETARIAQDLGVDGFSVQMGVFTTPSQVQATQERFRSEFGLKPTLWSGYLRDVSGIQPDVVDRQIDLLRRSSWRFQFRRYPSLEIPGVRAEPYFYSPELVFGKGHCQNPWKRAYILPNGDLSACSGFVEYRLGSLREHPFMDIWNGEAMRTFRSSLTSKGLFAVCSRCCDLYELENVPS